MIAEALEYRNEEAIYDYIINLFPVNSSDQIFLQEDLGFGTKLFKKLEPEIREEFGEKLVQFYNSYKTDLYYCVEKDSKTIVGTYEELEDLRINDDEIIKLSNEV